MAWLYKVYTNVRSWPLKTKPDQVMNLSIFANEFIWNQTDLDIQIVEFDRKTIWMIASRNVSQISLGPFQLYGGQVIWLKGKKPQSSFSCLAILTALIGLNPALCVSLETCLTWAMPDWLPLLSTQYYLFTQSEVVWIS